MRDWEIKREREVASRIGDIDGLFDCDGAICRDLIGNTTPGAIAGHFKDEPDNPHYEISYFPLSASCAAGYMIAEELDTLTNDRIYDDTNPGSPVSLQPTELCTKLLQGRYIDLIDERALLREALHEMSPSELDELGIASLTPGPIHRDREER